MPVTDQQAAALRAYLAQDAEETERLNNALRDAGASDGYGEFISAAFVIAVRQHFPSAWTRSGIIEYVAEVRTRWPGQDTDIDPLAAEILIRQALGEGVQAKLDELTQTRAQVLLLGEFMDAAELDDTRLDEFIANARFLANEIGES